MSDEKPAEIVYAPGVDDASPPRRPAVRWGLMLLIALLIIGATAVILGPNFVRTHGNGGQLTACKSNCKNLATALEMYASDNGGRYPVNTALLISGNYLKLIPTCPLAGKDTYSGSYVVAQTPDRYTFYCAGLNHEKSYAGYNKDSTNFPQYLSEQGLQDHP